ncbi:MAG: hypothetical protein R3C69_03575 [Geminicoccaceae bacterium]
MFAINVRAPFFLMQDTATTTAAREDRRHDRQHPLDVEPWRPALHHRLFRLEGCPPLTKNVAIR